MRISFLSLLLLAACGAPSSAPSHAASRVAPPPTASARAAATADATPPPATLTLRALDLKHTDCTTGPLAAWVAEVARGTRVDGDEAWTGPARCKLTSPSGRRGEQPIYFDLDRDGVEEAIV